MMFDAVIILAGGIGDDYKLPNSVKKRIDLAHVIFKKRMANKFLMSGKWSVHWDHVSPKFTEAGLMRDYALQRGFTNETIFLEEYSQNTFENAFYSIKLFVEPKGWKNVLVVTSDFHLRRSKQIFEYLNNCGCNFYFIGAKTKAGIIKKTKWWLKEIFLSNTQWLFQYFLNG